MHALKVAQTLIKSAPAASIDVPGLHDNTSSSTEELGRFFFELNLSFRLLLELRSQIQFFYCSNKYLSAGKLTTSLTTDPFRSATEKVNDVSDETSTASPTIYEILAYDTSLQKVTRTRTSTLAGSLTEKSLSFKEALSGLENPAKFVPHFTKLQNADYKIASAGPHVLIFEKVQDAKATHEEQNAEPEPNTSETLPRYANPIDGTISATGNYASPTGFVNYDPPYPVSEPLNDPPPIPSSGTWKSGPKDKVHRQEDVFTGSSRRAWQDQHENHRTKGKKKHRRASHERGTFKRMVLVGLLTAGGCYAVGVASEFLRM